MQPFQYISCYSLSVKRLTGSLHRGSFNTSHVTLYQRTAEISFGLPEFQYISCYSLSVTIRLLRNGLSLVSIHLMLLFIHAGYGNVTRCLSVSIHLMLLFIGNQDHEERIEKRFNTSHVTLYPYVARPCVSGTAVSIHLMLLFIPGDAASWIGAARFQYISCYSLSVWCPNRTHLNCVSIHLMLLFIHSNCCRSSSTHRVSIHLMLLFIKVSYGFFAA